MKALIYSLPCPLLSLTTFVYYTYLSSYYSDKVSLTFLGALALVTRIFDGVIDPFIGRNINAKNVKYFFLGGGILLAFSFFFLLTPPFNPYLSITLFSFLYFLGGSMFYIPYETLGVGLFGDSPNKTRSFALRDSALLLGTIVGAILPEVLGRNPSGYLILGIIICLYLPILLYPALTLLKDIKWSEPKDISISPKVTLHDKPNFKILLVAYTINAIGASLPATLIVFFVENVIKGIQPGIVALTYLLIGMLFLPLWSYLAKKYGAKKIWIISSFLNTLPFLFVIFLGEGDVTPYLIITVISAFGFGGAFMTSSVLQAEVLKKEAAGQESSLIGIWSVAKKLAEAFGAAIALPTLEFFGFVNGQPLTNSAKIAMSVLYCVVPSVTSIVAVLTMRRLKQ